jgi:hypothetical protein
MAMQSLGGQLVVLRAGGYSSRTHVFAPPAAALLTAHAAAAPAVTARFEVTYTGFSDEAKAAFQAAVDVWSVTLTSGVPIRVDAHFTPLDPGVLGSAGPEAIFRDFTSAPRAQTWYPGALANKLSGTDLSAGSPHITANFNSDFSNWYLGIDGATPADRYDLMSVVLHELGHGLGFVGSANVGQGVGSVGLEGLPLIYDHFIENNHGEQILNASLFPSPSAELAGQLQSSQLFFNGARAVAANGNTPVRIYAPITWEGGSSFSHLNEVTFPAGNSNSLMTPQIGMAEAIHFPGRVGTAVLRDLGW